MILYQCSLARCSVGFSSAQRFEQFLKACLVFITLWAFAVGLDPVGMLAPQVLVNLLLQLSVGVDFVRHGIW